MRDITQIRISGFGGQGVILVGVLLGEAGVLDGSYVAGSSSYGAQARGSGCRSEIIFSDGPVDYPHLTRADVLVAMSQGAYDLYSGDLDPGTGLILYDDSQVVPNAAVTVKQIGIPATDHAIKELKSEQVANIVLLGALIEITGLVSDRAVEEAVERHVGERFRSLNLEALKCGRELVRQSHG